LGKLTQTLHPIYYAENPPEVKEQVFNWFLPSPKALQALLQNTGFEEVDIFSVVRDRAVLVCRKGGSRVPAALPDYIATLAFANDKPPAVCAEGEEITFLIRVTNSGRTRWPASGRPSTKGIVRLGAHLLRSDEEEVNWDYGSAPLPRDLNPGDTAEIEFAIRAPQDSGAYIIEFDLAAEHVTWFEDFGPGVLRHSFAVQ
jgi:hypothetical protein